MTVLPLGLCRLYGAVTGQNRDQLPAHFFHCFGDQFLFLFDVAGVEDHAGKSGVSPLAEILHGAGNIGSRIQCHHLAGGHDQHMIRIPARIGMANPPHTTSPNTSYKIYRVGSVHTLPSSSYFSNAVMIPRTARSNPRGWATGFHTEDPAVPREHDILQADVLDPFIPDLIQNGRDLFPSVRFLVESAFGSQPICITL